MDSKLVEFLKSGATVLTPTRRLATRMLSKANQLFSEKDIVWSTPLIFSLDDWFMALWDQFEIQGVVKNQLLSHTQSLLLFEKIIEQSEKGKTLLQTHSTAKLAYEAWKTLHFWEAQHLLEKEPENIDEATFQEWAIAYHIWLKEHECTDGAQLISNIISFLTKNQANVISLISFEKKLVLYGFEEHAPILSTFFQLLAQKGWEITHLQPAKITAIKLCRQGFSNEETECKAAASWAQALLKKNISDIAIVTPHLTKQRNKIEAIFRDCLDPLMICDSVLEVNREFNISAAIPLIQYPIIAGAFEFLRLNHSHCTLSDYLAALTSPFSSHSLTKAYGRSRLKDLLKQRVQSKWTIDMSLATLEKVEEQGVNEWKQILTALKKISPCLSGKKSMSQWRELFREILHIVGWPGDRSLSSIEHQTVKRFDELLNELISCDRVIEIAEYPEALALLEKLCANIPFQAENKNAPIQLLGLLEAAGQHFEHLWVMGLHSEAWPENAKPNPFISIRMQRKLKMPHASPDREMQYAKKVTQRLMESAQEVVFSYPLQDKEKILEVSELIASVPMTKENKKINVTTFGVQSLFDEPFPLEQVYDENAPAISSEEKLMGNATLLSLQSACPFKAFAQIRLGVKPIQKQEIWLTPREQGIVLHRVLELFWSRIKDSGNLLRLSNEEIEMLLNNMIHDSMKSWISNAPHTYIEVEKMRLQMILRDYIALEKQREPFKIISLESQQQIVLGDLTFHMRIDRIDEDSQGDRMIIDYKTGQFQLNHLWGERPQAPQLPLYYVALKPYEPRALMITSLNSKGCEFIGISQQSDLIQGVVALDTIKNDHAPICWDELYGYWQYHLEKLVFAFQEGQAMVSPLQGSVTCQYCQLSPLCRINDRRINEIRTSNE